MKSKPRIRTLVQILFLVVAFLIAVNHTLSETGKGIPFVAEASLHAVCPFGGVVSLHRLLTAGSFVKKTHESNLVLMMIVFVSALLMGPLFCGWLCPFGTVQEAAGRLGRRIIGRKYNRFIPAGLDAYLRYLRYLVLLWVLVMTARSGELIFASVDPYYALFQFWTGEVALSGFAVLAAVLILSFFVERPFCKYACPYGAVLGLFNLFRLFPLRRNASSCIACRKCDLVCPMNIRVSESSTVRNHQCISCYQCVSEEGACPVEKTLEFRTPGYKEEQV